MNIAIFGDVHGQAQLFRKKIDELNPDIVLQVGDFFAYGNYSVPVYFISGNHENIIEISTIRCEQQYTCGENCSMLDPKEPLVIDGDIRILGVNSIPMFRALPGPAPIYREDYLCGMKQKNIDIFLCHEPAFPIISDDLGQYRNAQKESAEILNRVRPVLCFSGHVHKYNFVMINNTRCYSLPAIDKGGIKLITTDEIRSLRDR